MLQESASPSLSKHYIFVDYENVQPAAMAALDREHCKVFVFVGAAQAKISYEIASVLQAMGERAEYIKISGNGSNALDFHIAFYLGQIATEEPEAHFHILSKDTGFQPLIEHLRSRKIRVTRSTTVAEMPPLWTPNNQSLEEKMAIIADDLTKRGNSRPRTLHTLGNTIHAIFQKQLTEKRLAEVLESLQKTGYIVVGQQGRLSYHLPTPSSDV